MPKLIVNLKNQFATKAMLVHDEKTFEDTFITGAKAIKLFTSIPKEELQFEIVSTNENCGASFIFDAGTGKKGSIFEVLQNDKGTEMNVRIEGEFSVSLRSGVAGVIKGAGKDLDLRIRGVAWKGGAYNGFMAFVKDSDHEQEKNNWQATFPKVTGFTIK